MSKSIMKTQSRVFALTEVCRGFSNGDRRLLGGSFRIKERFCLALSWHLPRPALPLALLIIRASSLSCRLSLINDVVPHRQWVEVSGQQKDESSC